jgi:hypothetical protein
MGAAELAADEGQRRGALEEGAAAAGGADGHAHSEQLQGMVRQRGVCWHLQATGVVLCMQPMPHRGSVCTSLDIVCSTVDPVTPGREHDQQHQTFQLLASLGTDPQSLRKR